MSRSTIGALACIAVLLVGCGGASSVGTMRFRNEAPVLAVNDQIDVATKPPENRFSKMLYHFDGFFHKRLIRASKLHPHVRAQNLNSHGEVPNSTYFTNRIGVREMSAEEVGIGPNTEGSPELHKPWTVKSSKVGGVSIGFIIKDSRGYKYLLKFDQKGEPEVETAADVIVAKLLWACGYNVPQDYIVEFKRSDLVLADDAKVKTLTGQETPLTDAIVESQLAEVDIGRDGTIRGLVSRFASGVPLGGHPRIGTRAGDINDRVAYQERRDIRGQYSIFSWLDHTDIKEDNTLDMWAETSEGTHYVAHYLIDFGKALGAQAFLGNHKAIGHAYVYDFKEMGLAFAGLGILRRPWEGRKSPPLRGVGLYESESYDPAAWKAYTPSYFPLLDRDRFDGYWGAKIVIRFTREQLAAVVATARYRSPESAEYIVEMLVARQRKTARYWFGEVAPLETYSVRDGRLCFTDLAISNRLIQGAYRYKVQTFDGSGASLGKQVIASTANGEVCTQRLASSPSKDGYTIVKLTALRGHLRKRPVLIHLAVPRDSESTAPRVIGIRRR